MTEEREHKYYTSVYEIAAAINSADKPEHVLNIMVEDTAKALGAKGCSLMLLSPDGKLWLHTASYGLSDGYIRKVPIFTNEVDRRSLNGEAVIVENVPESPLTQYPEWAKEEGIVSVLSIPVMLKDKVVGVMRVYTAEPRRFTEDDIYFVKAVVNLGAIALANARLLEALKKDSDALRLEISEWRAAYPLIKGE